VLNSYEVFFIFTDYILYKMENTDSVFLIKELRKGNKNAFEFVFKKYYSVLCIYATKYCGSKEIAEEIVSQFFLNFYDKRETLTINVSLKSYLFRSVRNTALNYIRDNSKLVNKEYINEVNIKYTDTVQDTLIGKELEEVINKAIDNLPDQCRIIFIKSRFEEKKYKEIAEELNISVNTVETQMSRALKKLRTDLKDYMHFFILLFG